MLKPEAASAGYELLSINRSQGCESTCAAAWHGSLCGGLIGTWYGCGRHLGDFYPPRWQIQLHTLPEGIPPLFLDGTPPSIRHLHGPLS
jgi:hypothetical protein